MLRSVANGYVWHCGGIVPVEKIGRLAKKMTSLYSTEISEKARWYRKTKGLANAKFFLYPRPEERGVEFVLLLSDGEHSARFEERFRDAREGRCKLKFDGKFELLKMPSSTGKARWTWRLTQSAFEQQAEAIRAAVRASHEAHKAAPEAGDGVAPGPDFRVRQMVVDILGLPGFHGLRLQMRGLLRILHGDWKRIRGEDKCPYASTKPKGYLRFVKVMTMPLDDVVARMMQGQRPIPRELVYLPKELKHAAPEEKKEQGQADGSGR